MATTRIMPLHVGKGRTESRAISDIMENGFARIVKEFQNRLLRMLLLNPIECYVQIIRMY